LLQGNIKKAVHPSSIPPLNPSEASQLQPDGSAAHQETFLPLLPSGPDGVQKLLVAQNPVFCTALLRSGDEVRGPL